MKRTKKFKINILDIVIVLIAIACVIGVVFRKQLSDVKKPIAEQTAIITFSTVNIRDFALDETLKNGDKFFCTNYNDKFGELCRREDFIITDAKKYNENSQGMVTESALTYRKDIQGYIKVTGRFDEERGFLIDGVHLVSPGEIYEIYSANRKFSISVLNVEIVD